MNPLVDLLIGGNVNIGAGKGCGLWNCPLRSKSVDNPPAKNISSRPLSTLLYFVIERSEIFNWLLRI